MARDKRVWTTADGRDAPCVCGTQTVARAGTTIHRYCEECSHCYIRPEVSEQLVRECEAKALEFANRVQA